MLLVVFGHTVSLYNFSGLEKYKGFLLIIQLFFQIFLVGLMPAFFLISGYGFRKRSFKKCFRQQVSMILRPYCYVALCTVILNFFIHYFTFGYWQGAVKESLKIAVGFLLALPQNMEIAGVVFFSCGAIWYLVALFLAWIFLAWILEKLPDRYAAACAVGTVLLGWLIGRNHTVPFCLSQGLIAVGELYVGYQIKKKKWFSKPLTRPLLAGSLGAILLSFIITVCSGKMDNMADGVWVFGPFSIILDSFLGFILIRFFLKLNQYRNWILRIIDKIGRNSFLIFCVHTVEMLAIPWYLFAAYWERSPMIGFLLQFVLRSVLIVLVCVMIRYVKVIVHRIKKVAVW